MDHGALEKWLVPADVGACTHSLYQLVFLCGGLPEDRNPTENMENTSSHNNKRTIQISRLKSEKRTLSEQDARDGQLLAFPIVS